MSRIRNVLKKYLVRGLFMSILAVLLLRTGGANAVLALTCGQWNVFPTAGQGYFNAVTAVPGKLNDIWAAGSDPGGHSLIEHWNGKKWKAVTSPNIGNLSGIAAVSARDLWAISYKGSILHWNGKNWSNFPSPPFNLLEGITALASNDVWAVGLANSSAAIEHWDGTQWGIVPSPNILGTLYAISAISSNDIWAVGGNQTGTLAEHWDGTQWSVIPTANPGGCAIHTNGVVAISSNDVWMVGDQIQDCNVAITAFSEHWDGTQWTNVNVPSPRRNSVDYSFSGVAATSSNNVWAVGLTQNHGVSMPLTERWDGTQWNVTLNTNPGALYGVTATSAGDFWAVGYNEPSPPLAEFYC